MGIASNPVFQRERVLHCNDKKGFITLIFLNFIFFILSFNSEKSLQKYGMPDEDSFVIQLFNEIASTDKYLNKENETNVESIEIYKRHNILDEDFDEDYDKDFDDEEEEEEEEEEETKVEYKLSDKKFILKMTFSVIFSIILSFIYTVLISLFPFCIILLTFAVAIGGIDYFIIFKLDQLLKYFTTKVSVCQWIIFIGFTLVAIVLVWSLLRTNKIQFTSTSLNSCLKIFNKNIVTCYVPTLIICLIIGIFGILLNIRIIIGVYGTIVKNDNDKSIFKTVLTIFTIIIYGITYYYDNLVLKNIIHVMISSLYYTYNNVDPSITIDLPIRSLIQTLIVSLGSISWGDFLNTFFGILANFLDILKSVFNPIIIIKFLFRLGYDKCDIELDKCSIYSKKYKLIKYILKPMAVITLLMYVLIYSPFYLLISLLECCSEKLDEFQETRNEYVYSVIDITGKSLDKASLDTSDIKKSRIQTEEGANTKKIRQRYFSESINSIIQINLNIVQLSFAFVVVLITNKMFKENSQTLKVYAQDFDESVLILFVINKLFNCIITSVITSTCTAFIIHSLKAENPKVLVGLNDEFLSLFNDMQQNVIGDLSEIFMKMASSPFKK